MGDVIPHDAHSAQYQAWFVETLQRLLEVIDYTETISQIPEVPKSEITEMMAVMRDHMSLLQTEADVLDAIFLDIRDFVEKLQHQRNEAISERDSLRNKLNELMSH